MEVDILSINAAVSMTDEEFLRGFTGKAERGAYEFLEKNCPDCDNINYDAHFGPYIFFTALAEEGVFEEAKRQILSAATRWVAEQKA